MIRILMHDPESGCHLELVCDEPMTGDHIHDDIRAALPGIETIHMTTIRDVIEREVGHDGLVGDWVSGVDVGQVLEIYDIESSHPKTFADLGFFLEISITKEE